MTDGLKPYPATKDPGVPWLGDVPAPWERRRLKSLLRPIDHRSSTGTETLLSLRRDHGIVVYSEHFARPSQGATTVGYKIVKKGQLVVNRLQANNGLVFDSSLDGLVSPDYSVFEARQQIVMRYLSMLLRTATYRDHFRRESTGLGTGSAGFLRLYDDRFLETPVFWPSVPEQADIVRFLDHADRRIHRYVRAKQRLIALLEEQKQAIVHRAVTRGLDPTVRFKRSGVEWLGDVPEHWQELPLKRMSTVDNSGSYGVEPEQGDEVAPVATTAQIGRDGHFSVDRMPRRGFSREDHRRYSCRAGDILVVKSSGSIFNVISGKAGIVRADTPPFVFSNFLMRIRPRLAMIESEYLFLLLSGYLTRERVKRMVSGTTYPNLRVGEYMSASLPVPPLSEQLAIVSTVAYEIAALADAVRSAQQEIDLLREFRNRLFADVVTGGLDVREAAARLPSEVGESHSSDEADTEDAVEESPDDLDAVVAEAEG